jgi:hypothetical protein
MPTKFDEVLSRPPSGRKVPVMIDHASYGSSLLLRGDAVPWLDPAQCQAYFAKVQGMLRPDTTLVDLGAACAGHLAQRPDLAAAMGARTRTGYALKTLLADDAIAAATVRLVDVLARTSRQPLVLQVPSPLCWLALAQIAAGDRDQSRAEPEHAESASIYIADWLRHFGSLPVTLVVLDGRRAAAGLTDLAPDELDRCTPLANLAEHYRWGLALRTDDACELAGGTARAALVPPSFWADGALPSGELLLAEIPGDAEPELVLARLTTLC